jgi:hypothetical protein
MLIGSAQISSEISKDFSEMILFIVGGTADLITLMSKILFQVLCSCMQLQLRVNRIYKPMTNVRNYVKIR